MRALVSALVCGLAIVTNPARAETIIAAEYAEPTERYDHGVLGDAIEWGALRLTLSPCADCTDKAERVVTLHLPEHRVFEDVAPRVVDVGEDGPLVMVVESDLSKGARLALYDTTGPVAVTPFIGQRNRWLAPVGAADLDGDGKVELAYVDRPHLAKTLRIWRYDEGSLQEVASFPGVTNHRIGEPDIAGGIRNCGTGPEMIVASADFSRMLALQFDGEIVTARDVGPHEGRAGFAAALECS